jgi:hypothetical protein
LDALQRSGGALHVVEAERLARVPAEVELDALALQVLLADRVERAGQAELEDGERGLSHVARHVAAHVFLFGVVDGFVRGEVLPGFA